MLLEKCPVDDVQLSLMVANIAVSVVVVVAAILLPVARLQIRWGSYPYIVAMGVDPNQIIQEIMK